jgi:GT2 family glycosyltransferase
VSSERQGESSTVPDVSIVIASWNAKPHLVECLRSIEATDASVRRQTIVVDNASTDGSVAAVYAQFPWVEVIQNSANLGFARATNIGIERSTGRYICLMNSDVVIGPHTLGALVSFMETRPQVGLAGPRVRNPDGSPQASCRHFPNYVNVMVRALALDQVFPRLGWYDAYTLESADIERSVEVVTGCICLVRRRALCAVGLLDERFFIYSEDVDWCRRFHAAGWDVRYCPTAEAVHVKAASSSITPRRFAIELQRAQMQYFRKHFSRPAVLYFSVVALLHHLARILSRSIQYAFQPCRRSLLAARIGDHAACLRCLFPLNHDIDGR